MQRSVIQDSSIAPDSACASSGLLNWPAHKDLATGGADEVGNRKTLVPDGDKWGARFEELVQLTGLLER
jgi:hypothetical protein